MKIDALRIAGINNNDFPINNILPSSRFIITSVSGLGPTEVDVHLSDLPDEGAFYQGRRPRNRQIVMQVKLNPLYANGETVSDLRSELYLTLARANTDGYVTVYLRNNNANVAQTRGFVSKIEPVIFTKDPEIQIVIDCVSAYFEHPTQITIPGEDANSLIFTNPGDAPTGFIMQASQSAVGTFTWNTYLYRRSPLAILDTFYVTGKAGGWQVGDGIELNTNPGSRNLRSKTASTSYGNAMELMQNNQNTRWPMLTAGEHQIQTGNVNSRILNITFTPKYLGF